MIVEKFKSIINSKEKLFAITLLIALISILFVLYTKGIVESLFISSFILLFIWLGKFILAPNEYLKTYLKKTSIWAIVFLVGNFLFSDTLLQIIPTTESMPSDSILIIILATILFIYLINRSNRDNSAMQKHSKSLADSFSDRDFVNRFNRVTSFLKNHLKSIDLETNWSSEHFTPLEAEVEIQHKNRKKRKITDLLSAIKTNKKSKTFLVLGDPGSGKSVALRKLCEDLLDESKETGKIPIYVNLREWEVKEKWSKENRPTPLELRKFIKKNLKSHGDRYFNKFINDYFDKLLESGRIFIVLDSFDEIPALLDENESSWLVDELSKVIYNFLDGTHGSRGILSSRLFRRPTKQFKTDTTLEIRPFSEEKIRKTFINYLGENRDTSELINHLFKDRTELVPIARNPFNSSLLAIYAEKNSYELPLNQAELYKNYIEQSLNAEETQEKLNELNLTTSEVIEMTTNIADFMFSSEYGLEVPLKVLEDKFSSKVENIANSLKFIRLARVGGGSKRIFSFSHRRFNEYFVSQKLLQEPHRIPKESIPTDSRFRDALVMVCEVADEKIAKGIASFCFAEIQKVKNLDMNTSQYLRSIHSLRFLKDAFRTRLNLVTEFQDELKELIKTQIENKSMLTQKLLIEAVGLLKDSDIDEIIIKTLRLNNSWLNETAINACRNLDKISKELEYKIINYINSLDFITILKRKKELSFSFGLSDGFGNIYKKFKIRLIDIYLAISALIVLILFEPIIINFIILNLICYIVLKIIITIALDKIPKKSLEFSLRSILVLEIFIFTQLNDIDKTYLNDILFFEKFFLVEQGIYSYILLICSVLIFNWYHILYYVNKLNFIKEKVKEIIFIVLFYLVLLIISISIHLLLFSYGSFYIFINFTIFDIYLFLSLFLSLLLILNIIFTIIYGIISYSKDYFYYKKINITNNISRRTIYKNFNNFKTPYYRLKYIEQIELNITELTGDWEDGNIPNKNNDEASIRLAKFEERYLGLDR